MQRTTLASLRAPCSQPYGFWLDSALVDGRLGSRSFWGREPSLVLRSWGRRVEIERCRAGTERFEGDPLEVLRKLLAERRGRQGAAVGYLGYGLERHVERLPDRAVDDLGLPECLLAFYDELRYLDPRPLAPAAPSPSAAPPFATLRSSFTREGYEAAVRRALAY